MTLTDWIAVGSLGAQAVLWLRRERVNPVSPIARLLNLLLRQKDMTKLVLSAVHLVVVLTVISEGPNLLEIARDMKAGESVWIETRPMWDEAFESNMLSKPLFRDPNGVWKSAR